MLSVSLNHSGYVDTRKELFMFVCCDGEESSCEHAVVKDNHKTAF